MEKILRDPEGLRKNSTENIIGGFQRKVIPERILRNEGLSSTNTDTDKRSTSPVVSIKSETKVEKILRDPEGQGGSMKEEKIPTRNYSTYQYKPRPRLTSPVLETPDEEKENTEVLVYGNSRPRTKSFLENNNKSLQINGQLAERMEKTLEITSSPKTVSLPGPFKNEKCIFAYPIVDTPAVGSLMAARIIDVFPMSKDCQLTIFNSSKTQLVNEIEQEMGQLYTSENTSYYLIDCSLSPGCYGVFIPEWDKWVRCYIDKLFRPGKEDFSVKLVDYATTKTVSRKHLRWLTKRFYALPEQSYRAKLHITRPETLLQLQSRKDQIIFFHVMGAQTHGPSGFVILSLMMTCESKKEFMDKGIHAIPSLETSDN